MSKETKPRAVDEQFKTNLRERDAYAFNGTHPTGEFLEPVTIEEDFNDSTLFHMNDAALIGRHAFYERESVFARDKGNRDIAKREMKRTELEQTRRKIATRNEANKSFAGQAANDLEAEFIVEPAIAA